MVSQLHLLYLIHSAHCIPGKVEMRLKIGLGWSMVFAPCYLLRTSLGCWNQEEESQMGKWFPGMCSPWRMGPIAVAGGGCRRGERQEMERTKEFLDSVYNEVWYMRKRLGS